jgi:ribonucleotide reductase alpha subunit
MQQWSNLAKVVTRRTYSRKDNGVLENWDATVDRVIAGNVRNHNVSPEEINRLRYFMQTRKAMPAGRGLWFSGAPAHDRLGGVALNNCWFIAMDNWESYVDAMDLLMLGGGVGLSVEHRYVSKLPRIKKGVTMTHVPKNDADFIVPDSREGWCELFRRVLEAYFVTGKGFSYSTLCIRGYGEPIAGFGGTASGPLPLVQFIDNLQLILGSLEGKHLTPTAAADIICATGQMVVAGNVRRSAIIILGDPFDKQYLTAKRWDMGQIPSWRGFANYSVVCDDIDDLHPLFWKTYEQGEPFGIVNRKNIQTFGRMGERKRDTAIGTNPCAEATLENFEPCVAYDTPIVTKTGLVFIGEEVGKDIEVWNGDQWSKVTPRLTGTNRILYRVHFSDGAYLDCTDNHKFSVKTKLDKNYEKTMLKDIKLDPRYPVSLEPYRMSNTTGNPIENAYTLGMAVGNGWEDNGYVFVGVYRQEEKAGLPIEGTRYRPYTRKDFGDTLTRIRTDLNLEPFQKIRAGDFSELFAAERNSVLEFLAGWMDADGTETESGTCRLYLSGYDTARSVQLLLSKQGIPSTICLASPAGTQTNKGTRKRDLYYLSISECQDIPCKRLNTSNGHSPRGRGVNVTIKSIEKLPGQHNTYCFNEPEKHMAVFGNVLTYQCNLQEIFLPNLKDEAEFVEAAVLMHRYGKRVTTEKYHIPEVQKVINKNRRVGTGITGCLQSDLFNPSTLDNVYKAIQAENVVYSSELGINESIRTTLIKPSGTLSKLGDVSEGIHPAYARHMIQRIRFAANDPLIPVLRAAGHHMEPAKRIDGSTDHGTLVVDFYVSYPDNVPTADEYTTWQQLDDVLMAQKYWSDQSISVTVYYKREEIPLIKEWLANNLQNIKTISFLCWSDHGFVQAPKEAITREQYEKLSSKVKDIDFEAIEGDGVDDLECASGACPIK